MPDNWEAGRKFLSNKKPKKRQREFLALVLYYSVLMVICIWDHTICTFIMHLQRLLLVFWNTAFCLIAHPAFSTSKETSATSIISLYYLLIHFGTSSYGFLFPSSTQKGLGSSSKIQARHMEGAFENPRMVLKGTLPTVSQQGQPCFYMS